MKHPHVRPRRTSAALRREVASERESLRKEIVECAILIVHAEAGTLPMPDWQIYDFRYTLERYVYALEGRPPPWDPHVRVAELLAQLKKEAPRDGEVQHRGRRTTPRTARG